MPYTDHHFEYLGKWWRVTEERESGGLLYYRLERGDRHPVRVSYSPETGKTTTLPR